MSYIYNSDSLWIKKSVVGVLLLIFCCEVSHAQWQGIFFRALLRSAATSSIKKGAVKAAKKNKKAVPINKKAVPINKKNVPINKESALIIRKNTIGNRMVYRVFGEVYVNEGGKLAVREEPSQRANVIKYLDRGEVVFIRACDFEGSNKNADGYWCMIDHNSYSGWAWSDFLRELPNAMSGNIFSNGNNTEEIISFKESLSHSLYNFKNNHSTKGWYRVGLEVKNETHMNIYGVDYEVDIPEGIVYMSNSLTEDCYSRSLGKCYSNDFVTTIRQIDLKPKEVKTIFIDLRVSPNMNNKRLYLKIKARHNSEEILLNQKLDLH